MLDVSPIEIVRPTFEFSTYLVQWNMDGQL